MTLYPWAGDFETGDPTSCVAVITLSKKRPVNGEKVAIWGRMQTENIGIEKVVANVVSNPNIRFLIFFGEDVKGHRSGASLKALHENGIDDNNRIIGAPGAVPFMENLPKEAIPRFQEQLEIIDMMGVTDMSSLDDTISDCISRNPGSFGEPLIVVEMKNERITVPTGEMNLHHKISLTIYGEIGEMEG